MPHRLPLSTIDSLASGPGVRRIAVENFLSSAPPHLRFEEAAANMRLDAALYRWNEPTQEAILAGLQRMYRVPPWRRGGVRRNPVGRVTVDEWYDNFTPTEGSYASAPSAKDRKVWHGRVYQDSDSGDWVFEAASGKPGKMGAFRELARSKRYGAVSAKYIHTAVYTKSYQGFHKSTEAQANDPGIAGETASAGKAYRAGAGERKRQQAAYEREERQRESDFWRQGYGGFRTGTSGTSSGYGSASSWGGGTRQEERRTESPRAPSRGDPYAVLGVTPSTPWPEVRSAWKRLMAKWHPDVNRSPEALVRAQQINEAFQTLQARTGQRNPSWHSWRDIPIAVWAAVGVLAYGWWEQAKG